MGKTEAVQDADAGRGAPSGTRGPGSAAAQPKTRRENSLQGHDGLGLSKAGKASRCAGRNNSTTTGVKTRQPKNTRLNSHMESEIEAKTNEKYEPAKIARMPRTQRTQRRAARDN